MPYESSSTGGDLPPSDNTSVTNDFWEGLPWWQAGLYAIALMSAIALLSYCCYRIEQREERARARRQEVVAAQLYAPAVAQRNGFFQQPPVNNAQTQPVAVVSISDADSKVSSVSTTSDTPRPT